MSYIQPQQSGVAPAAQQSIPLQTQLPATPGTQPAPIYEKAPESSVDYQTQPDFQTQPSYQSQQQPQQPQQVYQQDPSQYVQQPQQPQPQYATQQSHQFMTAQPLAILNRSPAPVDCPSCGARALTAIKFESGDKTQ